MRLTAEQAYHILTRSKQLARENMRMKAALRRIMRLYKPETDAYKLAERALK